MSLSRIPAITFLSFFLISGIFLLLSFSNFVFPWQRQESIKAAVKMGGLAELPENAEDIEVEKMGSPFTRQFIIEFHATETEIRHWINNSKRLRNTLPKKIGEKKLYEIYPGENGAVGGRVEIIRDKVIINISWS